MSEGEGALETQEGPNLGDSQGEETTEARERRLERTRGLVAALRSGNYAQTTKVLARYMGEDEPVMYCCLGVACEVANGHGLGLKRELSKASRMYRYVDPKTGTGNAHTMPVFVYSWFGFTGHYADNPRLKVPDELISEIDNVRFQELWQLDTRQWVATELNDEFDFTLAQIGDCFEYTFLPDDWEVTRVARG